VGFADGDADGGFEPLAVVVDEGDHADGRAADGGGEADELVVFLLLGSVQDLQVEQCCKTIGFRHKAPIAWNWMRTGGELCGCAVEWSAASSGALVEGNHTAVWEFKSYLCEGILAVPGIWRYGLAGDGYGGA